MANSKTGCMCGSGGHPRRCDLHPWAYSIHVLQIEYEQLYSGLEDLEEKLDSIQQVDSQSDTKEQA